MAHRSCEGEEASLAARGGVRRCRGRVQGFDWGAASSATSRVASSSLEGGGRAVGGFGEVFVGGFEGQAAARFD